MSTGEQTGLGDRPGRDDESRLSPALPYVPRVLCRSLAKRGSPQFPWSDEIDGTLVMADISGFTAMSEQLARCGREGAEQLTDIITSFFTSMLDKARVFGGDIITYGGDAMLLLFTGKDHERRAVAASLDMLDAMQALPPYRVGRARIRLGMSMGAHTDRFPIFGAGTDQRAQFFILGPATVRTAECEARANSGELVVSAETRARCRGMSAVDIGEGLFRVDSIERERVQAASSEPREGQCAPERLLPYVPPFVADAIRSGEDPPALDSDHRKVSIAFVNVLGVDELLAEDREVLAAQLQAYVTILLSVLERHAGYLVSNDIYTNGFKLIVAFGAPIALERDAERAVRFSIELRDRIEAAGLRLRQRIGINRGDVFAGDVGPEYRRQYTVMGDAVNLSARLMSAADTGAAMTTCDVAEQAGDSFSNAPLEPIRVKGKSQPIDVCLLESEIFGQHETEHALGETPFVGRRAEMAAVKTAAKRAGSGDRVLVSIFGDPGMGKSRLVTEEVQELAAAGWSVHYGMSYQHTSAMPFTPWVEILTHLIQLDDCSLPEDAADRIREVVGDYAPREIELACLLGQLLGVPIEETDRSKSLEAAARRRALLDLVNQVFTGAASKHPVCLVLEDLQWADASSLELLEHVASAPAEGATLLILATSRSDAAAVPTLRDISTDTVDLAELADEAALALVSSSLGIEIPEESADLLLRKSKSNPLFLQEVARGIVRTGALERIRSAASTVAVAHVLGSIEIPDSVQALLMSRVDHLDPASRELLRTASVIGATFTLDGVLAIVEEQFSGGNETTTRSLFDHLVTMQFLEPTSEKTCDADELRFTQPLLQEVTYNSVRFARRRSLHLDYARYLEQMPDVQTRLGALVHHYSRAGEREKTALYGVKAAERASRLFAHREAVDYAHMALSAIRGSTPAATWERSCIVERVGDGHEWWGHYRDAIRAYKDALNRWSKVEADYTWEPPDTELASLLDETPRELRRSVLCRKIGTAYQRKGQRYDLADWWLDQALAVLPEASAAERAAILMMKGFVAMRQGRNEDAVRFGNQVLAEARASGDLSQRAMALQTLYAGYDGMGEIEKAMECVVEVIPLLEELNDLPNLIVSHGNLASAYWSLGQLEAARHENEIALELEERLGSLSNATMTRVNLTEILIQQGRFEEARECLARTFEGCEEIGVVGLTGYAHLMSARLYAAQGALDVARTELARAIELIERANYRALLFEAYVDGASIALESGNLRGAARALAQAEREAKAAGKFLEIRLHRTRGLLARRQGDYAEAHEALRHAIALARETKAQYELALSILTMADVAVAAHEDWPERQSPQEFVAEAIELFRKCGAEADLGRAFELQDRLRMAGQGESALARVLAESGAPERHLDAGTLIVAEGDSGHEMFLIRSGVVRVFRGHGVDEFTLGLLGSGDFFGEMSLVGQAVRSASVRAVTDVDLIALDKEKFDEVVSDPIAREIIGRMSDRIRELGERAEQLSKLERPLGIPSPEEGAVSST